MRFEKRYYRHKTKVQGEAASADVEAAASSPEDLGKIVNAGGYTKQQTFNLDEAAFYWKKEFHSQRREVNACLQSFRGQTDPLGRTDAAGDFKRKLMLTYHSENLRVLENCPKSTLPVLYTWNKTWMTAHLFTTLFLEHFKSIVKPSFSEKNFFFQNMTTHDHARGHPRGLMVMYSKINIVFMPANITSILQPVDQEVISTFKFSYSKNTCCRAIAAIDGNSSDGSG